MACVGAFWPVHPPQKKNETHKFTQNTHVVNFPNQGNQGSASFPGGNAGWLGLPDRQRGVNQKVQNIEPQHAAGHVRISLPIDVGVIVYN